MKTLTTTGIERAVRAAIAGKVLDTELAERFAGALEDAACCMGIAAEDRIAEQRAGRLLDLADTIAAACVAKDVIDLSPTSPGAPSGSRAMPPGGPSP